MSGSLPQPNSAWQAAFTLLEHLVEAEGYPLRFALCLGVLIMLCAAADAATARRFGHPERHFRLEQRVVPPTVVPPKGIAVPGWTDEETRQWLNSASGPKG
jgi:hypothetical protein